MAARSSGRRRSPTLVMVAALMGALLALVGGFVAGPETPRDAGAPAPIQRGPSRTPRTQAASESLPPGPDYPQEGRRTWRVLGNAPDQAIRSGPAETQRVLTYTVEVEDGVPPVAYGGDAALTSVVESTLTDPRGWTARTGIVLRRVTSGTPAFRVSLTSPRTTREPGLCGFTVPVEGSCYDAGSRRVVVDLARWVRGAVAYAGDLDGYRQYAVNHEVGHALGQQHHACPADGAPAPVMMQQTYGTQNAAVHRIDRLDPSDPATVPDNGLTCRPNPWPSILP